MADMVSNVVSAEDRKAESRAIMVRALNQEGRACLARVGRAASAGMFGNRVRLTRPVTVTSRASGTITPMATIA